MFHFRESFKQQRNQECFKDEQPAGYALQAQSPAPPAQNKNDPHPDLSATPPCPTANEFPRYRSSQPSPARSAGEDRSAKDSSLRYGSHRSASRRRQQS